MVKLGPEGTLLFLIAIAILLGCAKFFGELAKRFGQPAVLGELLAGILLGPTVLGTLAPNIFTTLFHSASGSGVAMDGLLTLSAVFVLLVVGFEVDLAIIKRERRIILWIGLISVVLPYAIGAAFGWFGHSILKTAQTPLVLALLMGSALAISALPVIARILMDLNLLKTRIGSIILGIATVSDITGWLLFTIALGFSGNSSEAGTVMSLAATRLAAVVLTILFAPRAIRATANKFGHHFQGEGAAFGTLIFATIIVSAASEWFGIHAIFGAFLVGLTVAASGVLGEHIRHTIEKLTVHVFAPLFFGAVGLKVNFISNFNPVLIFSMIGLAVVSKMLASYIGGWIAKISNRDRIAIGLGITARGGMGIILASVALDSKLASNELFEALVVMAVITSMISVFIRSFVKSEQPEVVATASIPTPAEVVHPQV